MAIFGDLNVGPADEDIAFMYASSDPSLAAEENDGQPSGLSIMYLRPTSSGDFNLPQKDLNNVPYDYNRIAAIFVDEPYNIVPGPPWPDPCDPKSDSGKSGNINAISNQLLTLAQKIRQQAPRTRFWVNYSEPEVQWMMDGFCTLNNSTIDVVSMDKYQVPFAGSTSCLVPQERASCVQPYYDWLVTHRAYPGQQIALIPGTFADSTQGDDAQTQALRLQGFFDYAAKNQSCNVPLGNTGATGRADGCLIWTVIGFGAHQGAGIMIGEDDPGGEPIQQLWRAQVNLPLSIEFRRPSAIATLANGQISTTFFFAESGQVWDVSCATSGCVWDDPSGDASANPLGSGQIPAADVGSPMTIIPTLNGSIAYFISSVGHLISLNTSQGFSDTWQDITASGGNILPAVGSSLVTVLNGSTPFTFFFANSGQVIDNWCTGSGCTWDNPSGDASGNPNGTGKVPSADPRSPLSAIADVNGIIACYFSSNDHLISLNTSQGFSDTWQDVTAAGGSITPDIASPLVTILNGQTPFMFFLGSGGQVIDNWCSALGCTWDNPSGDASRNPNGNGQIPTAVPGSPLTVVATPNGMVARFITSSGHLISVTASQGFSDTWMDETAGSGAVSAASNSPLSTVMLDDATAVTHFISPGGHVFSISCTASGQCTSKDETATANSISVDLF
jgi:hypothetical protein